MEIRVPGCDGAHGDRNPTDLYLVQEKEMVVKELNEPAAAGD